MKDKIFCLIIFLLTILGCSIKKYDRKILLAQAKFNSDIIHTNGFYFSDVKSDKNAPEYMFFYKDGTIIIGSWVILDKDEFKKYPEKYLATNFKNLEWNQCTGQFLIENDTIIIEVYQRTYQGFYKYQLEKYKAVINNDTTLNFFENECQWCHGFYGNYEKSKNGKYFLKTQYKYYPSDFKPDSSLIWFKNEKWYKNQ